MDSFNPKPICQIYLKASASASKLSLRASNLSNKTKQESDRQAAKDIATAADRFSKRAKRSAEKVITLMNDGALKDYCMVFDKAFKAFIDAVPGWEQTLSRIEAQNKYE